MEIVELSPERGKAGVVEIFWQDVRFDGNPVVDNNFSGGWLGAKHFARDEGDDILILLKHLHETPVEVGAENRETDCGANNRMRD